MSDKGRGEGVRNRERESDGGKDSERGIWKVEKERERLCGRY